MRALLLLFLFGACNTTTQVTEIPDDSPENAPLTAIDSIESLSEIWEWVETLENLCDSSEIVIEKGDISFKYAKDSVGFEILKRLEIKGNALFEEFFIERDSKLVYAFEGFDSNWEDMDNSVHWGCYYIIRGEEIEYSSLGMGETEGEDWEPESIFPQWIKCQSEFVELQEIRKQ